MAFVDVSHMDFTYEHSRKQALRDVTFSVERGDYIALLGSNGSGKSTLARLLAGFLSPQKGSITIHNDEPFSPTSPYAEYDDKSGTQTVPSGIVFQSPRDQFVASIVQFDTAFGPENLGCTDEHITYRVEDTLRLTRLSDKTLDKVQTLSGGQKQKLAFAGISALHPQLLILDESTAMIDSSDRSVILALLDTYNRKGCTIIHVTHDITEALHAKRILILDDGTLVYNAPSTQLPTDNQLHSWKLLASCTSAHKKPSNFHNSTPHKSAALDIKSVSFSYENKPSSLFFKDMSLTIEKGSITAIVGNSGSGKSTLLELCSGVLRQPHTAAFSSARLATSDKTHKSHINKLSPESAFLQRTVPPVEISGIFADSIPSLCLQESEASLFEEFVADDIAFGIRNLVNADELSNEDIRSAVKEAMNLVGLPFDTFADRRVQTLSGGEKRKCAIAGIIALKRPIMLFDEPSAGLDALSRSDILMLLQKLQREGHTIVFTTHRKDETLVADRVVTLQNGKITDDTNTVFIDTTLRNRIPALKGIELLESFKKSSQSPYHEGNTLIHRLPAVIKYIVLLAFLICGIAFSSYIALGTVIGVGIVYAIIARYPLKHSCLNILKMLPWFVLFFVLQLIMFPMHALRQTSIFFLHFIAVLIPMSVFVYTTDESAIIYGIEDLLSPLKFLHIPVSHVALVVGIIFRWIPLLFEETVYLLKAQLLRGSHLYPSSGIHIIHKIRALLPLFVPLMVQTLRRAVILADAIQARYYDPKKRHRWRKPKP